MNKPKFIINRIGAQDRMPTVDTYLTNTILDDISYRILKSTDYDVEWREYRIVGRMIKLIDGNDIHYIALSANGELTARNSQLQSVPTALSQYLAEQKNSKDGKNRKFYFYFLPQHGNNQTDYLKFMYRLMVTTGVIFLNREFGLPHFTPLAFSSVKDLIRSRNDLRSRNSGNKSTYVTDEGTCYHIYGKTFGANQKETSLFCISISAITDKPVKLYQIIDNDSEKISDNDVEAIKIYSTNNSKYSFEIMDDTLEFDDGDSDTVKDKLRSPKFIYNLLSKFDGEKKCVLCGCKIEEVVQAAHIYPIASIRKRSDLTFDRKFELATDGDNGIWLCENHHKLFDRGLIWFEEGKICISDELEDENIVFVKQITTIDTIEPQYINDKMLAYFDLRTGTIPRLAV
ncbi:MAG: HNH endonuclease [Erysipelotrichaceae bacterium]|nr:HNH endonuclease [Erysipelotrichaceae bacterium]